VTDVIVRILSAPEGFYLERHRSVRRLLLRIALRFYNVVLEYDKKTERGTFGIISLKINSSVEIGRTISRKVASRSIFECAFGELHRSRPRPHAIYDSNTRLWRANNQAHCVGGKRLR